MENSFQTSFIPKKPLSSNSSREVHAPTSLFTILSVILLIIMGIASAGLFLYKNYLGNQKQVLSESLSKVRDTFEKDTIDELDLYNKRVDATKKVLTNHIVLSPMFALLGTLTLPSIQYTTFNQSTSNQGFAVKISGIASDYRSIALQADTFNSAKGRLFKNVIFSNLNRDKNGNVTFDLEFIVDPSLLSYEKDLILEQAQAKTKPDETTSSSSQSAQEIPNEGTSMPINNQTQ
jgi:hypothetical protein